MTRTISKRKHRAADGFTLIELMVVVLILGILMAIAIPTFLSLTSSAKTNAAEADLTTAVQDESNYLTQYGDFDGVTPVVSPASDNVLATSVPPGMAAADPGINWVSTDTLASAAGGPGTKTVYVWENPATTAIILGSAGQNGKFYWVSDIGGSLTYAYTAAATLPATATPWAGTSWKTAALIT